MIKNIKLEFFLYALLFFCLTSCAGNPGKEKKVFTGIVLDEKSEPVSEMELDIKTPDGKKLRLWTDDEGFFYIPETKNGKFSFHGEKAGYSELEEKLEVRNLVKIYCFQVQSADSVFDEVEGLVILERYKEAVERLKSINSGKNKDLKDCIDFYKKKINGGSKCERS